MRIVRRNEKIENNKVRKNRKLRAISDAMIVVILVAIGIAVAYTVKSSGTQMTTESFGKAQSKAGQLIDAQTNN